VERTSNKLSTAARPRVRIESDRLERLKRDVSIVRLVEARGVKLSGQGDNLLGLCPLHDDKNPSLVLSPHKNLWHCLGACRTGGDVIAWVMKSERVSFRLAVEMLEKNAPSLAATKPAPSTRAHLEKLAEPDESDRELLVRVVDYYHQTAKERPELGGYLEERGLVHGELVDHFRLGYANRTLGYRLPVRRVKSGEALRSGLQRLGIYRESGHEHFAGSLVIPVFGEDGEVLEMYGRKIRDDLRKGTPLHLYLPSRPDGRRGVFNLAALRASKDIILTEALIDALTFWCAGFRNVTSAYGVEGFTAEMRDALLEHEVERVLIAYDRDDAGDRAGEKLADELAHVGLEVFRVLFPKGMDANTYAKKVQPADKALDTAIKSAKWMAGTRPVAVPAPIEAAPPLPPAPALETTPPLAAEPTPQVSAEIDDSEMRVRLGDRRWRIRGLEKNTAYDSLRINLLVAAGESFYVDTLELYSARHREGFVKEAARELKVEERVLKSDLAKLIVRLEDEMKRRIEAKSRPELPEMTDAERDEALALLHDPHLLDRILEDFERAGVVGEETNKLVGYLAAVSRKLETPLAVVIQSSSAAGKSSLMEAVLRFVPDEERVQYSAMTGQSLFYMGETDLSHKVLAIAEEQGVQSAAYALKLLQSEGELRIASTGKDPTSGKLVTHTYRVRGPVTIFLTTTAIEVDEELLNRCLVLTVDEGSAQTSAIHERQRAAQTLDGLLLREAERARMKVHQNAQRLLEPLHVVNPLAKGLRFSNLATRTRRDHLKYLSLIQAIALLHQHQRPIKEVTHLGQRLRYIEATQADVEVADRLSQVVLGDVLDELPAQTRRVLEAIEALVVSEAERQGIDKSAVRFSRRDIRQKTRASDTVLKKHLGRLEELELLLVHAGGARRRMVYELAPHRYDGELVSPKANWAPAGLPLVLGGGRPEKSATLNGHAHLVSSPTNGLLHAANNGAVAREDPSA
jgi:DNA primase catalytic core